MTIEGNGVTRNSRDERHTVLHSWCQQSQWSAPTVIVECGERSVAHIGRVIDEHGEDAIAAVMMEPNAGTNGIVAPKNYWPLLRTLTRDRNVL
jgi:4-aminobutyrate aminotransferase-like enzyme